MGRYYRMKHPEQIIPYPDSKYTTEDLKTVKKDNIQGHKDKYITVSRYRCHNIHKAENFHTT